MPDDDEQMHPDDLKTIWSCRECGRNFVFNSDAEDHKTQFSHSDLILRDLGGKKMTLFKQGKTSLGFKVAGKMAKAIIEYKYYPSNDTIIYTNVIYTDNRLKSMIEGNLQMMRNIDNYIRKLQQQNQTARS
jgi:hypothetical protein